MPSDAPSDAPAGSDQPETDSKQPDTRAAAAAQSAAAAPDYLDAPEFTHVPEDVPEKRIIETITPKIRETSWNPEQFRAFTQSRVTFRLIWVLLTVLALGAALLSTTRWTKINPRDVADFFGIAFGAVVTLVTAATGFWFGTERGRRDLDLK